MNHVCGSDTYTDTLEQEAPSIVIILKKISFPIVILHIVFLLIKDILFERDEDCSLLINKYRKYFSLAEIKYFSNSDR